MGSLFRGRLSKGGLLLSASLGAAGCTTTLDPTTLDEAEVDPEPKPDDLLPTSGCSAADGMGGVAFSDCADLPPCTIVGEERAHLLCEHALSYDAASHECRLRGGYLVEVDSEAENFSIAEAAWDTVGTNVWLGGRRTEAFVWAWERSQIVFWRGEESGAPEDGVFVTWQPGEPNNSSTVSDEPEKCLALTLAEVDWNDRACSLELPFACEID
jgi:hypothetical protein